MWISSDAIVPSLPCRRVARYGHRGKGSQDRPVPDGFRACAEPGWNRAFWRRLFRCLDFFVEVLVPFRKMGLAFAAAAYLVAYLAAAAVVQRVLAVAGAFDFRRAAVRGLALVGRLRVSP